MDQNNEDIDFSHMLDNSNDRIKFEGRDFQRPQSFNTPIPKSVQLIFKYSGGFIKNEKQANSILIIFVILAIVVSIFLFIKSTSGNKKIPFKPAVGVENTRF